MFVNDCSALVVGTEGLERVDVCTMQRGEIVSIELEGFRVPGRR